MSPENIEDIYTLSPVQQGMLFHILSAPRTGMYFEQTICTLQGEIEVPAFQSAWQLVVDRHPSLRTAFLWEELEKPVQIVYQQVRLPFAVFDWRESSRQQQDEKLKSFLEADRRRSFNLTSPPLMRLMLACLSEKRYQLVWSSYHLVLDAWCLSILMQEVLTSYEAFRKGQGMSLPKAPPFRDYITWLKRLDLSKAEVFWQQLLHGFTEPTPLPIKAASDSPIREQQDFGQQEIRLSRESTSALAQLAVKQQLTLNTILQGAWALWLCHYSGKTDVVFGTVVSGRPANLPGCESMVGLFINTLPVRISIPRNAPLSSWLKEVQDQLIGMRELEDTPLVNIQMWSQMPRGTNLFESILVFLNVLDLSKEDTGDLKITDPHSTGRSNYPLALRIKTGPELTLEMLYDPDRIAAQAVNGILNDLGATLQKMIEQPDCLLFSLVENLDNRRAEMTERRFQPKAGLASLKSIKPRVVRVSKEMLMKTSWLSDKRLPLVMEPSTRDIDLPTWVAGNRAFIEEVLAEQGGLLFRGFNVDSVSEFEKVIMAISPTLLEYRERSTPRTHIGNHIYTSTEYPADEHIALHNEFSYSLTWPMKICFFCIQPANTGGETPIADSRKVFNLIDPVIRDRFLRKQVMYVRNYGNGVDLSWQEAFQTECQEEVENHCRKANLEFEWKEGNRLRTRQVRSAAQKHPITGESLWFNQVHLFHLSNLNPALHTAMLELLEENELPRNAYYGDGSDIEIADLDQVREAYRKAEVAFCWQEKDILLLDNMLVAHGRRPFEGGRKVAVAMAEPFSPYFPADSADT